MRSCRLLIEDWCNKWCPQSDENTQYATVSMITGMSMTTVTKYMKKKMTQLSRYDKVKLAWLGYTLDQLFDISRMSNDRILTLQLLSYTRSPLKDVAKEIGMPAIDLRSAADGVCGLNYQQRSKMLSMITNMEKRGDIVKAVLDAADRDSAKNDNEVARFIDNKRREVIATINERNVTLRKDYDTSRIITEKDAEIQRLRKENKKLQDENNRLNYQLGLALSKVSDDVDLSKYQHHISALQEQLSQKNRAQSDYSVAELYDGELDYILSEVFDYYIQQHSVEERKADVLNEFRKKYILSDVASTKKSIMNITSELTECMDKNNLPNIKFLGPLPVEYVSGNEHHKLRIGGDNRYQVSISKTGSDYRESKNMGKLITRTFT